MTTMRDDSGYGLKVDKIYGGSKYCGHYIGNKNAT